MNKILTTKQIIPVTAKLREEGKRIILVGGCFDILHIGHIMLLKKAKQQGDVLVLLLESDSTITKTKGPGRPINIQKDRAEILSHLEIVDYIVLLTPMTSNDEYDKLVIGIKPHVLATTEGDANRVHKERQAKVIGAKVMNVTLPVKNQSTTKLIQIFKEL